jgi:hypothetical protein
MNNRSMPHLSTMAFAAENPRSSRPNMIAGNGVLSFIRSDAHNEPSESSHPFTKYASRHRAKIQLDASDRQ